MALHSGKNCRFVIGGVTYRCYTWTAEEVSPRIDGTNSESGGRGEYITGGIVDMEFRGSFHWNGETPFTSIVPSGGYAAAGTADTGASLAGTLYVERFSMTPSVRGGVDMQLSGVFTGTVTKTSL